MQPHNQLKMLENYARSARMLEARGERTLAAKVHEAIDLNLANIQAHAPELYSDAMDAIARGCRQAEGEEAIKVLRDNGLDISVSDLHRKYGLPPYSRPEDVPPFQRVLAADLAEAVRLDPKNEHIRNSLSDLRDQGMLPAGSFKAWGIPVHPQYADAEGAPKQRKNGVQRRKVARNNHHLTSVPDRVMFILHWDGLFDQAKDKTGLALLRKHLRKLPPDSVEPAVSKAYAALEEYLRASQWKTHADLEWRPDWDWSTIPRDNGFMLGALKRFSSGAQRAASGAKRVASSAKRAAGSPATDRAISGTARAATQGAKAAGRLAGKGAAVIGKGLSDVLHKLRSNPEIEPAPRRRQPRSPRKNRAEVGHEHLMADLREVASMYWRAMQARNALAANDAGSRMDALLARIQREAPGHFSDALGIVGQAATQAELHSRPARDNIAVRRNSPSDEAQAAADAYAKAHGYAVADVSPAGKSAFDVYFRQHPTDNFGVRMRLSRLFGKWKFSTKP